MTADNESLRLAEQSETTAGDCPECGGTLRSDESRAETACRDCGLVVDQSEIDYGPEWRAFTQTEKDEKSRVGAPVTQTRHDKGLTTDIGWRDEDAYGNTLSSEKRSQMRRLRKWHERIRTKNAGERNLQFALSEIDRMASAMGVPDSVCEVASVMYRRALEEDLVRGRSIEAVAASALYAACRKQGVPRSLDELTAVARVGNTEIGRTYRYVVRELGLEMKPVDPKKYVPRFCSDLGVSDAVESKANEIIDTAAERGALSGKSPTGFAGAAIYAAGILCNEKRTQCEVAEVADVTEVTIRNRYQEQLEAMETDPPE
ncbi:MAG: transcription initiation factor IIB family protein [Halobacteriaceae archaeon]